MTFLHSEAFLGRLRSAALTLGLCCATIGSASARDRSTLNFNPDWKFTKSDPPGASQVAFDDAGWSSISAPHTFNDVDTFDDWSVPGHIGETNQWSGRVWYRKSFVLPESFKGKRVYLEFEAVRQVAEVYLNGTALGTNRTGFIPFGFDLTPCLRFGNATNVLAVMADNRFTLEAELARIAATELPWNSPHWHPAHGGIYRNVFLHVTDRLHITLPLYSNLKTVGPYVYSTEVSEKSARLHCEIPVRNERGTGETVTARVEFLDRSGKVRLQLEETRAIAADEEFTFKMSGGLDSPERWEPAYPYLYSAVCALTVGGRAVDSVTVPFGIRNVRFDAKNGFFINGRHLKLHGWGQRPTSEWPGLGAAHPDWMHYYTLALMKEAGGNFLRWGHCAGGPADIASGDRLGLVTVQPGVDGEGDASGEAWDLRAAAFRDAVIYFRNHPSIIVWEGGNQKVTREHAQQLRGYMATYDPHGGRVYAHRRADVTTGEFMDVDLGTEGGRQVPRLPVLEGEYNREESPRRVWDDFSPPGFGYPEAKGETYQLTSEQYAVNQVAQYVSKLGASYHCGGANWIFSDSTSGGRVGCEVARAGGEVDGVRLPKEAYYVCRAMFRSDPQVHIIGHWNYPAGTRKTVYAASNGEEVELLVNGRSLGRKRDSDTYLFSFPDVAWEAGEIKAVAYRRGKEVASQRKHTVGDPVALKLTPILGPDGFCADGSDVALVDIEAVDAKGERCPLVQQQVDFELAGPGIWRGGYNSGRTNSINKLHLDLECGINRVAVRATRTPGDLTLRARSSGLRPATLQFASRGVDIAFGCATVLPALPPQAAPVRTAYDEPARLAETAPKPQAGRFLEAFSYSGPTGGVTVKQQAGADARVYADRELTFGELPAPLRAVDWVQATYADRLYSAVDLMDLTLKTRATVYLAHDARLPAPGWLSRLFKPTELKITVGGQSMRVFERRAQAGESLTLGSNTEERRKSSCNMYIVFVAGE